MVKGGINSSLESNCMWPLYYRYVLILFLSFQLGVSYYFSVITMICFICYNLECLSEPQEVILGGLLTPHLLNFLLSEILPFSKNKI
jgi:hypothetical protein